MENLIGLVLPPVIDLVNSRIANAKVKYIVALGICAVIAGILHAHELNAMDASGFLKSAGVIFAEAQTVYKIYWSDSKLRGAMMDKLV